jgi:nitroimidazol reductase NimA-like FMN-containing flavoprotein (pyridoxamine 5'-phosphate oxidase superfamily)
LEGLVLGELSPTQVDHLLKTQSVGRLGCHADNRTYVIPVFYVFDGSYIYVFAREGLKVQMMRKNPEVCLQVDHLNDLSNWRSAIAWGTYEELQGEEASRAQQILRNRFASLTASETSVPAHGLKPSVMKNGESKYRDAVLFRIKITEKTGRFEKR